MTSSATGKRHPHARATLPPLRRRALAALIAAMCGAAQANPTLPQVINGQASFAQDGKLFSITNTPNTIINWQSFSIGAGETTRFVQQSANSAVLNRITGQDPSAILGSLQSNGKVFLINPNGILFGANARVDVNALVASSLNLSNQDFLAGTLNFSGDQAGAVVNQGTIRAADGGQVLLIAPDVENAGLISAANGDVLLAAGHSVQLADPANPALRFVVSAGGQALNVGQVIAQGGRIGMAGAVVRQRGVLNADSAQAGPGGTILLRASGQALLEAGSVTSARAPGGNGGKITVLGDQVGLLGDARVDASGASGGGAILLGGDYQGSNPDLPNARQVAVESGVTIAADALVSGNGGKIIAWGEQTTRVFGSLSARGGALSGDGGLVETSGHYLDVQGVRVDTSAAHGQRGTWLLDPFDLTVVAGSGGSLTAVDNFDDAPTSGTTTIGADLISGASSNVVLQALHDITFQSAVNISTAGVGLTATAGGSVNVNAPIATNGGAITLSANDVSSGHAYGTYSDVLLNAALASHGGAVSISGDSIIGAGAIDTGSGSLIIRAIGAVNMTTAPEADGLVTLGGALTVGGNMEVSAASTLQVTGAVNVGGVFRLEGGDWIQNSASLPLFFASDFAVTGGSFLRVAGGDGASDPYRIVDVYGLQGMARHNAPLNFVLANNIDASSSANWNAGEGFSPIYGGDGYAWDGQFNGAGFSISGLLINGSGLFQSLSGSVRNLTLAGGDVFGTDNVGALAGQNLGGTIANVQSSMTIRGARTVGGLVGYNAGAISASSASGAVAALAGAAGGLVGANASADDHSASISSSFATGSVSGSSDVGGLVGVNYGSVTRSYATGTVQMVADGPDLTHENMGGLIGYNNTGGSATEVYSTGQVLGAGFNASTVGGLVGHATTAALESGYWDIDSSGLSVDYGGGAGLSHAQMLQPASFTNFDFTNTWRIYDGYTTPLLKALLTPVTVSASAATSKVYDGQVATFGGTLSYTGLLAGDLGVDGSAGYGAAVNVGSYALGGLYSTKYDITLTGNTTLAITPRTLIATISASDKVYDGTRAATVAAALTGVVGQDAVSVSGGSGTFDDSNHGIGKTVVATGFALSGADAANYTLAASGGVTQASIAQKTLSTWIGGASGLWSDAANWDGAVVPVADNVLAASIAGANGTISYTAAAGTTMLRTLTSSAALAVSGGSLTLGASATDRSTLSALNLSGGTLLVNGALASASYAQSASTLSGAGSLTVGSSFSQTGGAIALAGDVAITELEGDLRVAALSGSAVSLSAPAGAISQSGAISAASLVTRSQSGTVLQNSGNSVASFTASNSGSGAIALTNATAPGQLVLGSLSTAAGDIVIENSGAIESHAIAANGGNVSLIAHSPVNVLGAISGNDVSVQASTDVVLADGASISAAHSLALTAGENLLLQGDATLTVPASGSMALVAQRGSIVAASGVRIDSHGAPVSLSAPNGTVTASAGVFVGVTLVGVAAGSLPLATLASDTTIVNYASTLSQQYSPLNLLSLAADASTPAVFATSPAQDKLNGILNVKKMYCN